MTAVERVRHRGFVVGLACALAAGAVCAGVAAADGGTGTPSPPVAEDVHCIDRCLDIRTVAEGGRAEVTGSHLGAVKRVRLGELRLAPRRVEERFVRFVVPEGAESARPVVVDEYGNRSRSPTRLEVAPASHLDEAEGFEVTRATATYDKSFFRSRRPSKVEYLFEADRPTDVRIDVLKGKKRRLIDSIVQRDRAPFQSHTARWRGLNKKGKVAGNGKYRFRISPVSGGSGSGTGFEYYNHIFPIPAKHSYGDGLGAGRNHQGVDIFARCGVKVLAVRGGKVKHRAYHGAAGYYMVIDGAKTGVDYAYMHLARKGRPKLGERVKTGQRIGFNSDTGNASGCHLHFEMWSAPGWYTGGKVLDPMPPLKRWDSWS